MQDRNRTRQDTYSLQQGQAICRQQALQATTDTDPMQLNVDENSKLSTCSTSQVVQQCWCSGSASRAAACNTRDNSSM